MSRGDLCSVEKGLVNFLMILSFPAEISMMNVSRSRRRSERVGGGVGRKCSLLLEVDMIGEVESDNRRDKLSQISQNNMVCSKVVEEEALIPPVEC